MTFKNLFTGENRKKLTILGIAAIMLLLLLSTRSCGGKTGSAETAAPAEDAAKTEHELEERLTVLLEKIDGVNEVKVMVTLEQSSVQLYENDRKTQTDLTTDSESTTKNSVLETEVVLAGSAKEPLKKGTVQPKVRGAAVVCGGADDPVIREKVTYTVAKALNLGISKVYVTD